MINNYDIIVLIYCSSADEKKIPKYIDLKIKNSLSLLFFIKTDINIVILYQLE